MYIIGGNQSPVSPLSGIRQLTSVFWGYFSGGARNVHTDVVEELQAQGISQRVINYYDSVDRGAEGIQYRNGDSNYRKLYDGGVILSSLGLTHRNTVDLYGKIERFSGSQNPLDPLEAVVRDLARMLLEQDSDAIVSLKEQPVNLLVLASRYLEEVMGAAPKPIFVTLHRTDPGIRDRKSLQVLRELEHDPATKRYITGYIACAESSTLAYQDALELTAESARFRFVPNGIDFSVFHPKPREEAYALITRMFLGDSFPPPVNSPVVTLGARNSPEKNIGLFLEAAYLLLRTNPNAHAVMCGMGMDRDGLRTLMQQTSQSLCIPMDQNDGVQKRLHLLGKVSSQEMAALLNISNVVALTSLSEADPLVLKEGMLCGAVPVTTCCGDAPRVVEIKNPERHMLQPIQQGFMIGGRGILTSQRPADIVDAWSHAISHSDEFTSGIRAYTPQLNREAMGRGYQQTIAELMALRHVTATTMERPESSVKESSGTAAALFAHAYQAGLA